MLGALRPAARSLIKLWRKKVLMLPLLSPTHYEDIPQQIYNIFFLPLLRRREKKTADGWSRMASSKERDE